MDPLDSLAAAGSAAAVARLPATLTELFDFFFVVDAAGRICEYHTRRPDRLYRPPEQFLGRPVAEVLPAEAAAVFHAACAQAAAQGSSRGHAYSLPFPDGRRFYELSVSRFDASGHLNVVVCDITATHNLQADLRASEEKYRQLFETIRDAIARSDLQGRILETNAAFQTLSGYAAEELIGKTQQDLVAPEDQGKIRQGVAEQLLPRGYTDLFSVRLLRKDGAVVPVEIQSHVMRDPAGCPTGVWATLRDITARQQAERALRESEARFRGLYERMQDGLVLTDLEGRIMNCNPAFETIIGCREEELRNKSYQDITPPGWEAVDQLAFKDLMQHGFCAAQEKAYRRQDGTVVPVEVSGSLLRDAAGQPVGILGVVRDIAERKRVANELSRSRDLLEATQSLAHVGGWEWDIAHQTMYWTDETYRIHGMPAGELSAGSVEQIERSLACYDPKDRPVIADAFRRCAAEGQPYDLEFPLTRIDGQRIWIRTMANAVKDGDRMVKVVGTIMDITARKRAEEFLRLVLDLIPAAVFWKDRDSVFQGCNQAIARAAGLASPEQIVGKTDHDLGWKKEESDYYVAVDRWVMENDQAEYHIIEPQRQADGREVWLDTCKIPLHDEEGRVNGILGAFLDITESRNLEKALRDLAGELEHRVQARTAELEASRQALARSEEQFRQMAENIWEAFWLIEVRTRQLLYLSPAIETIWGRARDLEMPGLSAWLAAVHPLDRPKVTLNLEQALNTGDYPACQYRIQRPDGSIRWVEDAGWAIRDARGEIIRLAGLMRDITEHRRLEAEILHAGETERQRIGQDLHDSLCQALTAIGFHAEAVRARLAREKRPEAAKVQKLEDVIAKTLEQARALAQGLLLTDLSRGGLIPGLQALANNIQDLFGVSCGYEGPAEIRLPNADTASQFYRIAQEAATNAAKHGRGGQIVIQLASLREGVQLSVRDNGRGLPEPPVHSNGLGLDIMRYRAGMIGATLTIESRPGQGTTVNCFAPRPMPEAPAPKA